MSMDNGTNGALRLPELGAAQPSATDCNALTPQQEQAALLMSAGEPAWRVSDTLEVHRATLWRWRRLPAFEAALNRERLQFLEAERDAIACARTEALDMLRQAIKGQGDWPPAVRVSAARELLRLPPPATPGPTSAGEVEANRERAARDRRRDAARWAETEALFDSLAGLV